MTKHLKHLGFTWLADGIPKTARGLFTPENQIIAHEVEMAKRCIYVLTAYIEKALREAKVRVGDPPIESTWLMLTANARPEPYFDPEPVLVVDIPFDPLRLRDLPPDKEEVGELYIRLVEDGLRRLEAIPGYPCDVIRRGCEVFRRARYTYPFKAGERMIPGTQIKGQVHTVVSPVSTIRYFTALYRNKPLFQTKISETPGVEMYFSRHFAGFTLDGTILTVVGGHFEIVSGQDMVPSVQIDLSDYPEALRLLREKGWIGSEYQA